MKRSLLIAAVLAAPLYLRQRQVERRLRAHLAAQDRELEAFAEHLVKSWEGYAEGLNRELRKAFRR